MRTRTLDILALPATCWGLDDMLDALARRDVGHVFRAVQKISGASQTRIGIATGLSQAQVSEVMSGKRQVSTVDVLARIADGLAIPPGARMVLFMGNRKAAPVPVQAKPAPVTPDTGRYFDVTGIYPSRSEFMSHVPVHAMLDTATNVRAVGLSLNMLCQQYADSRVLRLAGAGVRLQCLFLDPDGQAIRAREREEDQIDALSSLTRINLRGMLRVRDRLPTDKRDHLQIAVYDETARYNIFLIDDTCIAQTYLPHARGVDAPTLVIRRQPEITGLYPTFEQIFHALWERGRQL